uniref:Leishmanolysin-like peptidase n=1 Tax=Schistosoma mansoni TaxID=6183 RepID=A0A5K4F4I0_SCHMA
MSRLWNHSHLELRMDFFNLVHIFLFLLYISKKCTSVCKLQNDYQYYHSNVHESINKGHFFIKRLKVIPHYTEAIQRHIHFQLIRTKIIEPAIKMWEALLKVKMKSKNRIYLFRSCINHSKDAKILSNGTRYRYCREGCKPVSECYHGVIPEKYLDYCYTLEHEQPKISEHRGQGMKFNHLLYIIDSQTISLCRSGNTVGYAQFCRMDGLTDRPIAGYTNLCPNNIEVDYESIRMATLTMAHELGHVLGFNSEAFRYMRDELGKPRTIRERVTNEPILTDPLGYRIPDKSVLSNVTRVWMSAKTTIYRYLTALKTPMILKMAKEYFNCPELDGVELDNNDQMYARGHFEKRLIDNELMTPLLSSRSYISKITLGFFEDTGWYQVNYAGANPMGYGKHLGCDFVMKSCYEYMLIQRRKRQSFYPYCDQIGFSNTLCLKHENAYGFCDLRHYLRPLPLEFQYFEDPRLGSADRFRDYCPAYVPFTGTGNTYSYCNTPEKQSEVQQNKNYMLHYFGASSMCINHDSTRHWEVIRQHEMFDESAPKSSCMNHICSESEGLILIFQDKELVCPIKGKYIDFSLRGKYFNINGSIICPPCRDICKKCPSN